MTAETTQLVLSKSPISVTLGLFDNIFITDPNAKEEEIIRGRITCAVAEDDSICLLSQVSRTLAFNVHLIFSYSTTECFRHFHFDFFMRAAAVRRF